MAPLPTKHLQYSLQRRYCLNWTSITFLFSAGGGKATIISCTHVPSGICRFRSHLLESLRGLNCWSGTAVKSQWQTSLPFNFQSAQDWLLFLSVCLISLNSLGLLQGCLILAWLCGSSPLNSVPSSQPPSMFKYPVSYWIAFPFLAVLPFFFMFWIVCLNHLWY